MSSVVCVSCKNIVDVVHTQMIDDPYQPYISIVSKYICLDCCEDDEDGSDMFAYSIQ